MERVTDYLLLWKQIVTAHAAGKIRKADRGEAADVWAEKAQWLDKRVKRRWQQPDSSRTCIIEQISRIPGATVLDIGAGTGAWSCLLAGHAEKVTAVEPSPAMRRRLRENLDQKGIQNVEIISEPWPEAEVARHDFSLSAHALYGCPDLERFVRHMEKVTRRTCFLLLRAPMYNGMMAEAAQKIWGQPYDSTNFQIAYNALLQMGIYAHVLMEDTGLWNPWTNQSLEEATGDVKRRMGLDEVSEYDDFLNELLKNRLIKEENHYVWPRGVRSVLVYWDLKEEDR